MDLKTAFLNGDLNEEIYMEQPEGGTHTPKLAGLSGNAFYAALCFTCENYLTPHESMEDTIIGSYRIPKKRRECDIWSDNVDEFISKRFIDSNMDIRKHNFELILFGSGRRACPDMNLGLLNVKLEVAQLVHSFNWDLPNGMSPRDMDMAEKFGLTAPRAQRLHAIRTFRL
ncbi:hypothetical protein HYC85_004996 [Camellia sinensis]|uniref:Reverse transcriptase Ty1/copia-type domain-containing protein n=1 Tax=Camellia sinensis TaxID=4442 RepID=A0A7J7HZS8_CAMSI|nr:hypothetical protein HYC85_004996 [Camellia sinensis]